MCSEYLKVNICLKFTALQNHQKLEQGESRFIPFFYYFLQYIDFLSRLKVCEEQRERLIRYSRAYFHRNVFEKNRVLTFNSKIAKMYFICLKCKLN